MKENIIFVLTIKNKFKYFSEELETNTKSLKTVGVILLAQF